jgi:hypothetical protein
MNAEDALKLPGGIHQLQADAVDPGPVPEPVLHPEFDREGAGPDLQLAAGLVRRRGGILRVEEAQPRVVGVGELRVAVSEHPFPGGRIEDLSRLEVQVEKAHGALLGKKLERGRMFIGGRRGEGAGLERRLNDDDVSARRSDGLLGAHRHGPGSALPRLDREDRPFVEERGEQDVPLGLLHLRLVADDVEGKELRKEFAEEFTGPRLPEQSGLLVCRGDLARGIEHQHGHTGGPKPRIGDRQGWSE